MRRLPVLSVAYQILWMRESTTPMQLLKYVYLAQAWMLMLHDRRLFRDPIEAWKYGPVVPRVYHTFKRWHADPIKPSSRDRTRMFSDEQLNALGWVEDVYGDWDAFTLSQYTHQPHSPWWQVYKDKGEGAEIPTDLIRDYYKKWWDSID